MKIKGIPLAGVVEEVKKVKGRSTTRKQREKERLREECVRRREKGWRKEGGQGGYVCGEKNASFLFCFFIIIILFSGS